MRRALLLLLLALALIALFAAALAWAQGETPIIVSDGSLTIESRGVPWSQFTGSGNTRRHPHTAKTVTSVDWTVGGRSGSLPFNGQAWTVAATYGTTTITITTGANGQNLQVTTDFSSFHSGATPNHLAHNNAAGSISTVTVKRGASSDFSGAGSGHTVITLHYR